MLQAFKKTKQLCNEETKDWLLPNKILNEKIQELSLSHFIFDHVSNKEDWLVVNSFLYTNTTPPKEWRFIHFMNEEWRSNQLNKFEVSRGSYLAKLYSKYSIEVEPKSMIKNRAKYRCKFIFRKLKEFVKKRVYGRT